MWHPTAAIARAGPPARTIGNRGRMRRLVIAATLVAAALLTQPTAGAQTGSVLVADVDGAITPIVAEYLGDAVREAERAGHEALLVTIDTPGGLDVAMRDIVQAFLGAQVPVIVYVSPAGARAASAGTFITMAGHVAAMAPGTAIGAATPVDLQGGEITDKIINDAVAFAVSVAEVRGRSTDFAEAAVRDGTSLPASDAVESGVVDLVAEDVGSLLAEIDGREVALQGGIMATLDTAGAPTERYELGTFRSILAIIADPNLAFLFLSLGSLALVYEFANPGIGLGGTVGVILLILAFFSLSVLPVQAAGLALFGLAAALFIGELFVPGVGVLAAGGTIALVMGGVFLFEGTLAISGAVLWPTAAVVGIGSALAGRAALKARRAPSPLGTETMVGRTAVFRAAGGAPAQVFLEGAWWSARPTGGAIEDGATVTVVGVEGLRLVVEEATNEH